MLAIAQTSRSCRHTLFSSSRSPSLISARLHSSHARKSSDANELQSSSSPSSNKASSPSPDHVGERWCAKLRKWFRPVNDPEEELFLYAIRDKVARQLADATAQHEGHGAQIKGRKMRRKFGAEHGLTLRVILDTLDKRIVEQYGTHPDDMSKPAPTQIPSDDKTDTGPKLGEYQEIT
jgi:hypothetical protein